MQVFGFISAHQVAGFLSFSRALRMCLCCVSVVFNHNIDGMKSGYS